MRPLPLAAGTLLTALGLVAVVTGEVNESWLWLVAASIASLGVVGLASVVRKSELLEEHVTSD